jgi:hypothetical protein
MILIKIGYKHDNSEEWRVINRLVWVLWLKDYK